MSTPCEKTTSICVSAFYGLCLGIEGITLVFCNANTSPWLMLMLQFTVTLMMLITFWASVLEIDVYAVDSDSDDDPVEPLDAEANAEYADSRPVSRPSGYNAAIFGWATLMIMQWFHFPVGLYYIWRDGWTPLDTVLVVVSAPGVLCGVAFVVFAIVLWIRHCTCARCLDGRPVDNDLMTRVRQSQCPCADVERGPSCVDDQEPRACIICLDALGDNRLRLKCSHAYHDPCLERWLAKHTTCPMCRADLSAVY